MGGGAGRLDEGRVPPRGGGWWVGLLTLCVVGAWVFPAFWYTKSAADRPAMWLTPRTNRIEWAFTPQSVEKSAEALLAADTISYGEYLDGAGETVRLFTAGRREERPGEIGLFVHTPDRCWTQAGWRIEPVAEDYVELEVDGAVWGIERRLFVHPSGVRELVYFFGLVGGQALPYRLDHNLGVGQRFRPKELKEKTGTWLRAVDNLFWRRVWESFAHRRQLLGPKQFVRISTTVTGPLTGEEDLRVRRAIEALLERGAMPDTERGRVHGGGNG